MAKKKKKKKSRENNKQNLIKNLNQIEPKIILKHF